MRKSGILMHITSLPGPYGVGTMGKHAFRFVDFLARAGQQCWQVLPLTPTGYGDSPYQSCSAFAGNHYLIDLDLLVEEGLLSQNEISGIDWCSTDGRADFGRLYRHRLPVLYKAFERFVPDAGFHTFRVRHALWLEDFALFMALKDSHGGKPWYEWEEGLRFRRAGALAAARKELARQVEFYCFVQYLFDRQWTALHRYARSQGIEVIGDVPIYVPLDSVEVWCRPELFQLDETLTPTAVAGVPPDAFTADGQLWGNPLYRWDRMASDGYAWWIRRLKEAAARYDIIRLDHFRGFESYWSVPYGDKTARGGKWVPGPGMELIDAIRRALPNTAFIAEDLGVLTREVLALRDGSGYPGMKVLEFAFESREPSDYLPHAYPRNSVCYVGTHDNMTMAQWLEQASEDTVDYLKEYLGVEGLDLTVPELVFRTCRMAMGSVSDLCVVQMQDYLAVGEEGRMNFPGTMSNKNWTWRAEQDFAGDALADRICAVTRLYGRAPAVRVNLNQSTFADGPHEIGDVNMSYNCLNILKWTEAQLKYQFDVSLKQATPQELHEALGTAVMMAVSNNWSNSKQTRMPDRKAYYFSAEYLIGRLVYSNLYNLGILDEMKELFAQQGVDLACLEEIEDDALGNGGLGRLSACFLDSAASTNIPLSGYGLRYRFGLFKQSFDENGSQVEAADDWTRFGDPWSYRRYNHTVKVHFPDHTVLAVPYDVPVIGYGTNNINTLRLWQCEAESELDFNAFNNQDYLRALDQKNKAEDITRVLYPNDSTWEGKRLRIKQQYVLSSASLQDMIRVYKTAHGSDLSHFADYYAVQLNDTHPAMSIPELIRLLMNEGMDFDKAFSIAQKTFSYTNHTVMGEALEKWPLDLLRSVVPEVAEIICRIDCKLRSEHPGLFVIDNDTAHMANLSVYVSSSVNGVAEIHSQILKDDLFKDWYKVFPERFQNKTNGITPRRWLGLCNPELTKLISDRIGGDFLKDLGRLAELKPLIDDKLISDFNAVKRQKKEQLCAVVEKLEGVKLNPDFVFDVQVKRLHEYKRQLMNIISVMDIYFRLKDGELPDFQPTVFVFGAKSAPGYLRAKAIIRYINRVARMINADPDVHEKLKVVFVQNYNCSYAEHIIPAADISEQISPAGTEASGTGNMKLMLNGAVTLGTLDGANVEIAQEAGMENEYIFGHTVEQINAARPSYHARGIYDSNSHLRRAINTLVDGTVPTDNDQQELYHALLDGTSWHMADHYFLLLDYESYLDAKLRANRDCADRKAFGRKCLENIASAGKFSSDRTIRQYAEEIWHIEPTKY